MSLSPMIRATEPPSSPGPSPKPVFHGVDHLHAGQPHGLETRLDDMKCYVSPSPTGSKERSIILIVDVFGYQVPNVRRLADVYASRGYYVYVPDILDGDSLPLDRTMLKIMTPQLSDPKPTRMAKAAAVAKVASSFGPWFIRHREAVTRPRLTKAIKAIRAQGATKLYAVGLSWGGRYAVMFAGDTKIYNDTPVDAAFAAHPSFLNVPIEVEILTNPTAFAIGTEDIAITKAQVKDIQKIVATPAKQELGCQVQMYEDAVHGFAVRSDQNDEGDRWSKEAALEQCIGFFDCY